MERGKKNTSMLSEALKWKAILVIVLFGFPFAFVSTTAILLNLDRLFYSLLFLVWISSHLRKVSSRQWIQAKLQLVERVSESEIKEKKKTCQVASFRQF